MTSTRPDQEQIIADTELRKPVKSPYDEEQYAGAIKKAVEEGKWHWLEDHTHETMENIAEIDKSQLYAQIHREDDQLTSADIIAKLRQLEKSKREQEKSKSRKKQEQQENERDSTAPGFSPF